MVGVDRRRIRGALTALTATLALGFAMSGTLLGLQVAQAAAADPDACAIQAPPPGEEKPGGGLYPEAERVQANIPGGEPEEIEPVLGNQFASAWFENKLGHARFYVGLTSGAMTLATATEAVDAILARRVSPGELPFIEAHTVVLEVPYSPAEISAAQNAIQAELLSVLPAGSFQTGQTVGADAGANRPGEWPLVSVELARGVSQADCETVEGLLAPYGGKVALLHSERELIVSPAVGLSAPGGPELPGSPHSSYNGRAPLSAPRSVPDVIGIRASVRGGRLELGLRIPGGRRGRLRVSVRLTRHGRLVHTMARVVRSTGRGSILLGIVLPASWPRHGGELTVRAAYLAGPRQSSPLTTVAL